MSDTKRVYKRCLIKSFLVDNNYVYSWKKALNALLAGKKVLLNVHVIKYGVWKTSPIVNMDFKIFGFEKVIETERSIYICQGFETTKKITYALFFGQDVSKPLYTINVEDTLIIEELIDSGKDVRAQVYFRDGKSESTSNIVEIDRKKHSFTTEYGTVYKW